MNPADILDGPEALLQQQLAATAPKPNALCTGIVDVHHGEPYDLTTAVAGGVVALIHKATEGKDWRDPDFDAFNSRATTAGVLRGAYHFASASAPGAVQADFFVATVNPTMRPGMLLVLDIERNPNAAAGSMDLANAAAFVARVHALTGRWPVFYSYPSRIGELVHGAAPADVATVAKCPLWLAQYSDPPKHVPGAWADWFLWQYSDWANGPTDRVRYPRETPGFGRVDRSCFRGTEADLRAAWGTVGT
jgi:lysozyme